MTLIDFGALIHDIKDKLLWIRGENYGYFIIKFFYWNIISLKSLLKVKIYWNIISSKSLLKAKIWKPLI